MLIWTIFKVGVMSLMSNKLRSILAMLGIIIGVAAVIAMLALGTGVRREVVARFASMGSNVLVVMPGQRGSFGVVSGTQQNLTMEDAEALVKEIPAELVSAVAPAVNGSAQVKYMNRNTRTSILGTSRSYFAVRDVQIDRGRMFTEREAESLAHVAVLGPTASKNLFDENDPVGETIKIKGVNFRIIGLAKEKGEGPMSPDDRILVPCHTAMKQLFGLTYLREIDIQVGDESRIDEAQDAITQLIRKRHRVQADMPDDVFIANMAEIRKNLSATVDLFRALLASIASISLLVGGIGIMNIMLVSVTERTREIGVRKAIGAKERHILTQFLIESVIISGLGGLLGVSLGVAAALIIPRFVPQLPSVIEVPSIVLAMGFSAFVGIFFGFYPAWRAAMLDPIEALRYE